MNADADEMRQHALKLLREHYEIAAGMRRVPLEQINRVGPPYCRYRSSDELFREWIACAGAVSWFAVTLGIITADEAGQMIRDFEAAHPEIEDDPRERGSREGWKQAWPPSATPR